MAENILTVENLSIAYQGVPAVMDVNFTLERGKVLTIVGESGSGKTTVIRALMGLLPVGGEVTDGTMLFNGQDLRTLSKSCLLYTSKVKILSAVQIASYEYLHLKKR